jgi:alpha-galactosidase
MTFTQIRFLGEPKMEARYRTGLTNYDEKLTDGRWVGRYWNSTGFVEKENLSDEFFKVPFPAVPIETFDLEIDGQSLHFGWKFVRFIEEEPNVHSIVELESEIRPIRLRIHTRLDGTPILTRWLEITNLSDKPAALSKLSPWSGLLSRVQNWRTHLPQGCDDVFSLGYFAEDVGGGMEGDFNWMPLPKGTLTIGSSNGRSGQGSPFFVLKNEALGTTFVGSLGWSGNWQIEFKFEKSTVAGEAWVAFKASPKAPGPMRVLAPNETIVSPQMHLGCMNGDLDHAVQAMHDHIRKSVMPPQPKGRDFRVVYNHWGYTEHELSEQSLFHEIDVAAEIGAELFIVDAGWFADKKTDWWQTGGDWREGNRLPRGLAAIREYAHKKGLLFGLWCEVEQARKLSNLSKEHPEWFLVRHGKTIETALDLTNPAVADYVESTINRLVEEHQLDLFRLDYNITVGEGGQTKRDGFMENTLYRHYEVLYGIFDRLREKFPNLLLENCSSGGGRTDLGLVSRFHHTWVTDWQVAPRSVRIFNGMSLALPPEYVDRNCGVGQNSHTHGDLSFQIRSCMLGHFTLTGFHPTSEDRNPEHIGFVTHCVSLYKDFIRPMLPESKIFHHTPVLEGQDPHDWCAIELASQNADRAVCGLFRLAGPSTNEYTIKPRGLNPGNDYQVTFDNTGFIAKISGWELMQKGLTVRLDFALTSELLLFESVKA